MKLTRLLVAGAAALLLAVLTPTAANAAGDPIEILQDLCESRRGDFYVTPYNLARCQDVRLGRRDPDPLAIEELICTDVLDGTFFSSPSYGRPNRVTWACY